MNMPIVPVVPLALADAIVRVDVAPVALLSLGRPQCPACELLDVTLGLIAAARPALLVVSTELATPQDWAARETLLWPRGIRVSRASMPTLVLLRHGGAVAHRHAGGPAFVIDEWLTDELGPGQVELTGVSSLEQEALAQVAELRSSYLASRAAHRSPNDG